MGCKNCGPSEPLSVWVRTEFILIKSFFLNAVVSLDFIADVGFVRALSIVFVNGFRQHLRFLCLRLQGVLGQSGWCLVKQSFRRFEGGYYVQRNQPRSTKCFF